MCGERVESVWRESGEWIVCCVVKSRRMGEFVVW